jgi:hypothetical protein
MHPKEISNDETPVDDVRRVRERLDREAGGDIHTLAERSRAAVEKFRTRLNLKISELPKIDAQRDGTLG